MPKDITNLNISQLMQIFMKECDIHSTLEEFKNNPTPELLEQVVQKNQYVANKLNEILSKKLQKEPKDKTIHRWLPLTSPELDLTEFIGCCKTENTNGVNYRAVGLTLVKLEVTPEHIGVLFPTGVETEYDYDYTPITGEGNKIPLEQFFIPTDDPKIKYAFVNNEVSFGEETWLLFEMPIAGKNTATSPTQEELKELYKGDIPSFTEISKQLSDTLKTLNEKEQE